MIVVLAFCGYLASLGGPGPYIGGLIAILDLLVMLALFFGLRPDHLTDSSRAQAPVNPGGLVRAGLMLALGPCCSVWAPRGRVPGRTEPPGAGRARGAQQLPPGLSPAGPSDQQLRLVCGLTSTGLASVPPYRATSGVPYCPSRPNVAVVWPGMTSPKFHTQL